MNKYELLYIIDGSLTDEEKEKTVNAVTSLVTGFGGKCEEPDKWGMRKFAYPINYKQEGYYCLMNFEGADTLPSALTARLNIEKNIVRHMIVAK